MNDFFEYLVLFFALINLSATRFILFKLNQPTTVVMWLLKVLICAISPGLFLISLLIICFGLLLHSFTVITIGSICTVIYFAYIFRSSRSGNSSRDFEKAFGKEWELRIRPEQRIRFLKARYVLIFPSSPQAILKNDIPFHIIEGTNHELLCDIWMPPNNIERSGLAFIYLHGSAWTSLDKDYGTRTFFKHLAGQGHVIMDVAYRLFPEAGFMGMVHDAKHAIGWMKDNADSFGINPERIVIGGGSAGAHIAMLAAYTPENNELNPSDLGKNDLNVHGVISLYGQADLKATYYHTAQHLTTRSGPSQKKKGEPGGMPPWIMRLYGKDFHRLGFDKNVEPGMLRPILGGSPVEKPDVYAFFSPISYAHSGCPPTLFIHGRHDILAPLTAVVQLRDLLKEKGVQTILHEIPQSDHAFDLVLPTISPPAHNAIYDVERFLALMALSTK